MHNIGRTVGESNFEYNQEYNEMHPESSFEYQGEYASQEMESEDEFLNELNGMSGEAEYEGEFQNEYQNEYQGEYQGEYQSEAEYGNQELAQENLEMELATELLSVTNEAELEQFIGKLVRRAAGAVKSFANSAAGKAIGGVLKSAAKKALPILGKAAGTFIGGPAGAVVGGKLGALASNLFELELEGLSNEDKEFELSRAYVRFANNAVRQAVRNPMIRSNPRIAVRSAVVSSARRWAPGLLRRWPLQGRGFRGRSRSGLVVPNGYNNGFYGAGSQGFDGNGYGQQGSGTWYRQGNQIIINL